MVVCTFLVRKIYSCAKQKSSDMVAQEDAYNRVNLPLLLPYLVAESGVYRQACLSFAKKRLWVVMAVHPTGDMTSRTRRERIGMLHTPTVTLRKAKLFY